ncbi:MAG: CoA-binding protein [Nanoarchaeota archaeon]|nr:CoA-binding protein [Nanoarchaeota archaeon]
MVIFDEFFKPESIAVIGASGNPGKIGYIIFENIKHSFKGEIYPINPNITEILGLKAYGSVKDVEGNIDLAIIAVPAKSVKEVVNDCIKKKIKGVIIISAGFSEIGEKGREKELEKLKTKIRIIGPNCIGVHVPNRLDMLFLDKKKLKRPPDGSIGIITDSGAVGAVLMDMAANEGVGISKFASIGNKIDVDEVDLMYYFGKDVNTRCIVIYLESTERGIEMIKIAKKITKPIVVFKAGKTKDGAEAVASHTGAMAGKGNVYSSAFRQGGIVEAETLEDIFDYSKVLSTQPELKGKRIAVITDGGGFGIMTVDALIKYGFEVNDFSLNVQKKLKRILPEYGIFKNPVDLTGSVNAEMYQKALDILMKDEEIDGIVCITLFQLPGLEDGVIEALRDAKMHGKPFVVCSAGGQYTLERVRKLEKFGVPVYPSPERAARAMNCLISYQELNK